MNTKGAELFMWILVAAMAVGLIWYLYTWYTAPCSYLRDSQPFSGGYAPARCISGSDHE